MSGRSEPLSVAVDARGLSTSGIGRYSREVLRGLLLDDRFSTVHLLGNPDELRALTAEADPGGRARIHEYSASWFSRGSQAQWITRRFRSRIAADGWFFPFGDMPLAGRLPRAVATVHDLIQLETPHLMSSRKGRLATRVVVLGAVRRAALVIAISESTRRDV